MSACPRCGLRHQCVCAQIPSLTCPVRMILLTHPNELNRDTNTGQLLMWSGLPVERHIWDRKTPPQALLDVLNSPEHFPVLLFPSDQATPLPQHASANPQALGKIPLFIILDATWQEARKMRNKSQWLEGIDEVQLTNSDEASRYSLRRNQHEGSVCTCEVGALLLRQLGFETQADRLLDFFAHYLAAFSADKSGHTLK